MAARCVIGVDLGGSKALAGAVDEELSVHHRTRRHVAGLDTAGVLASVVDAVEETRSAVGDAVEAVGIGVPALMDRRRGVAALSVHLPLRDLPVADVLSERLGLPVAVDNDGNCAALAEARAGAGSGAPVMILLTLGTGIGSGIVLDGRLCRGAIGAGAELGHMVIDADGPRCHDGCPNRGCLEVFASGPALVREARAGVARQPDTPLGRAVAGGRALSGPLVTEFAHDGDPVAREAIDRIGRHLGIGIVNAVNIFNPDVVVVGGGVSGAGEMLLAPAREVVAERALPPSRDHVRIRRAAFGEEAGMLGAALLAREERVAA